MFAGPEMALANKSLQRMENVVWGGEASKAKPASKA